MYGTIRNKEVKQLVALQQEIEILEKQRHVLLSETLEHKKQSAILQSLRSTQTQFEKDHANSILEKKNILENLSLRIEEEKKNLAAIQQSHKKEQNEHQTMIKNYEDAINAEKRLSEDIHNKKILLEQEVHVHQEILKKLKIEIEDKQRIITDIKEEEKRLVASMKAINEKNSETKKKTESLRQEQQEFNATKNRVIEDICIYYRRLKQYCIENNIPFKYPPLNW